MARVWALTTSRDAMAIALAKRRGSVLMSSVLCGMHGKLRSYHSHAEGLAVELSEFAVLLAFLPHAFAKQVD